MNGFGLKNLHINMLNKKSGHEINIHYKYFYFDKLGNSKDKKIKKLFLTYTGLMKVLFGSNRKTGDKFVQWATETLFVAQMGNIEQRTKLVSNLLGVSTQSVKEVFSRTTNTMPCTYLYSIGQVKTLRKKLKISTDYNELLKKDLEIANLKLIMKHK